MWKQKASLHLEFVKGTVKWHQSVPGLSLFVGIRIKETVEVINRIRSSERWSWNT